MMDVHTIYSKPVYSTVLNGRCCHLAVTGCNAHNVKRK